MNAKDQSQRPDGQKQDRKPTGANREGEFSSELGTKGEQAELSREHKEIELENELQNKPI